MGSCRRPELVLHEARLGASGRCTCRPAARSWSWWDRRAGSPTNELARLVAAGAVDVRLTDGVLRTSTAGVVACASLMLR